MRTRITALAAIVLAAGVTLFPAGSGEECSTLVASGMGTVDGAPLLWKNRDTDTLSNKVVFVDERPHRYLALVNAEDTSGRVAWAGLNSAGFAISNSVAYNLPQEAGEEADLEGLIMADALRTCETVADFEEYLNKNLGPNLGSRANFPVIDAHGGAAIFEVHNHGVRRLNAAEASEKYLANTNFSRSGSADQGAGYLRFDREIVLLRAQGKLSHDHILQVVARDLGHALLKHPERAEWKKLPAETPSWVHANYTINRASTASAVVVHGVKPGEDPRRATMWVMLGEPVTAIAVPLWVAAGQPPDELCQGKHAPLSLEASRLKAMLRPLRSRERKEYVDLTRLDNAAGTGWLPTLLTAEQDLLRKAEDLLKKTPTDAELREFQRAAAARALTTLGSIATSGTEPR